MSCMHAHGQLCPAAQKHTLHDAHIKLVFKENRVMHQYVYEIVCLWTSGFQGLISLLCLSQ